MIRQPGDPAIDGPLVRQGTDVRGLSRTRRAEGLELSVSIPAAQTLLCSRRSLPSPATVAVKANPEREQRPIAGMSRKKTRRALSLDVRSAAVGLALFYSQCAAAPAALPPQLGVPPQWPLTPTPPGGRCSRSACGGRREVAGRSAFTGSKQAWQRGRGEQKPVILFILCSSQRVRRDGRKNRSFNI